MTRLPLAAALAAALLLPTPHGLADDPQKKPDPMTAEANLRKAHEAVRNTDSTLNLLSKSLYVGSVLTKNPDLKEVSKVVDDLRKPASELKKHTEKVVELAEEQKDKVAAEKEGKTLLDKVKLVRISKQAEELDRLARKVRDLPVGLVSEQVDDKFVVSADLLVKDPKQAEARFKAYLAAMKTNAEYLKSKQEQLKEAGKAAKEAGVLLAKVQSDVEKAVPFSGVHAKPLTEFYLNADKLAKAYNGLASDCTAKAKQAERAAEVEQRRHDNLRGSVRMLFGFQL
jgi:hypothetical protein